MNPSDFFADDDKKHARIRSLNERGIFMNKVLRSLSIIAVFLAATFSTSAVFAHGGKDITVSGKVSSQTDEKSGKTTTMITDDKSGKVYTLKASKKMGKLPDAIKAGETASVYGDPYTKGSQLMLRVEKVK